MSSECTSERPATLARFKNASANLWEKMADDAFRKIIRRIAKVASIYKIISSTTVKDPPGWSTLETLGAQTDGHSLLL